MNKSDIATQRVRDAEIYKLLRKGKTPAAVIQYVEDNYGIAYGTAYKVVYGLNSQLKKSTKELADEAATYIMSTLINEIEDCDDDRKNKLKAIELLAKVCKVFEDKPNITINNLGFDFNNGDEQ